MIDAPIKFEGLEFDDEHHIYTLNGMRIPCVSDIIEPLTSVKYQGISESTLDAAAEKGTAVHNAIENWIKFQIEDVPPEFQGYFDAFKAWWDDNTPEVVGSEIRVYHKLLMYGGTLDLLSYIDGELTLTDFKCTAVISDMTCRPQLEGYNQALISHGVKIKRKQILHLAQTGKYKVHPYQVNDAESYRVFTSLKCVYDFIGRTK